MLVAHNIHGDGIRTSYCISLRTLLVFAIVNKLSINYHQAEKLPFLRGMMPLFIMDNLKLGKSEVPVFCLTMC
jgi:hypothetical protein